MKNETREEKYKRCAYFVAMFSTTSNHHGFIWPILPDPAMGEEFCKQIEAEREDVKQWIKENPEAYEAAQLGKYLPNPYLRKLMDLDNITEIQKSQGNWNYSPYMRGMANGLILAHSIMNGIEPVYLEEPEDGYIEDKIQDVASSKQ